MISTNLKNIPAAAKHIEQALLDLHKICTGNNIEYRIAGSTAVVGAVNDLYRVPHDVDFLYDLSKQEILHKELIKLGYKKAYQKFAIPVLVRPLTHYLKGDILIEPRGGEFTSRGFEFALLLPLPTPKKYWPHIKLVFSHTMIKPCRYKFGTAEYIGLSAEALWIGLNIFMRILSALEDKVSKRSLDLAILTKYINQDVLSKIKQEKPGMYYKQIPVATLDHDELISLAAFIIKLKKFLKN